jgi:hypothetical protein
MWREALAVTTRVFQDPAHGEAMRADLQQGLPTLPIWMQSVVREVLDMNPRTPRGRRRLSQGATSRQPPTPSRSPT